MSTLKEAVESGRRWRFRNTFDWHPPGPIGGFWQTEIAILDDFEIEPEPVEMNQRYKCGHPDFCSCQWPEPEKPREWEARTSKSGWLHQAKLCNGCGPDCCTRIRVHDADACDRLRGKL